MDDMDDMDLVGLNRIFMLYRFTFDNAVIKLHHNQIYDGIIRQNLVSNFTIEIVLFEILTLLWNTDDMDIEGWDRMILFIWIFGSTAKSHKYPA